MAMSEGGGARPPRPSTILSRDQHGEEHQLSVVDHPAGMIFISDEEIVRILSPSATAALVMDLIHAMGGSGLHRGRLLSLPSDVPVNHLSLENSTKVNTAARIGGVAASSAWRELEAAIVKNGRT